MEDGDETCFLNGEAVEGVRSVDQTCFIVNSHGVKRQMGMEA